MSLVLIRPEIRLASVNAQGAIMDVIGLELAGQDEDAPTVLRLQQSPRSLIDPTLSRGACLWNVAFLLEHRQRC